VADKIIQKYQTSTCEQLWVKKREDFAKSGRAEGIAFLKSDPQGTAVMNKVAPPIANKMFDCGMIP